jgi:1-acyl-sn-glycerol-3-phosphate acyltransferase
VHIIGNFSDNGNSVLVIANHISWWDGFWIQYLNLKILSRKLHFMMLEEQLKKHWYFNYTGGFSIKKKSRSILESINYSIQLLKQPENMLLMFPQGQIHSLYANKITFEKGIERIVNNLTPDTQILFVANLIDYLSDKNPNLFIYFKTFLAKDFYQSSITSEYNKFYEQVLNNQKNKIS